MTAIFPDMCKIVKVIPVHKRGKSVNDNYRPLSLLPVQSRNLEKNCKYALFQNTYKLIIYSWLNNMD